MTVLLIMCTGCVVAYFAPMAKRLWDVRRLQRYCTRTRTLVLSFDDGPGKATTPAILETLRRYDACASFFLTGQKAEASPDIVDEIRAAGHEIGTHTYAHRHAWKTWPWTAAMDVLRGHASLSRWLTSGALFRQPYGKPTLATALAMSRCGSRFAWWTHDSHDTRDALPPVSQLIDEVRRRGGGVVLLHDSQRDAQRDSFVQKATEGLLAMAQEQGLRVRTLREVLDQMQSHQWQPVRVSETEIATNGRDLSIVIVNWNRSDLLDACLKSIFSRPGSRAWEVIVVDNASGDDSVELVRQRYPTVNLIQNRENRGFAAANNQGIAESTGRHVLLLNSDTEILDNTIEESIAYMERRRTVGVMGVRTLNSDGTLQLTCFRFPSLINMLLLLLGAHRMGWPRFCGRDRMRHWKRDDERDVDVVSGCYFLVRRAAFETVGLLDEQFFFYDEETDWCVRARAAGWAVRFAPVGEIVHHGGASSMLLHDRGARMFAESRVRLHRKHCGLASALSCWSILLVGSLGRAVAFGLVGARGRAFLRTAKSIWLARPSDQNSRIPSLEATRTPQARRAA